MESLVTGNTPLSAFGPVLFILGLIGGGLVALWRGSDAIEKQLFKSLGSEDGRARILKLIDDHLKSEDTIKWIKEHAEDPMERIAGDIANAMERGFTKIDSRLDNFEKYVTGLDSRVSVLERKGEKDREDQWAEDRAARHDREVAKRLP